MPRPFASLSMDLDNKWAYLKTHGDPGWEAWPTYLPRVVPRILDYFRPRDQLLTFFVVGRDAERAENRDMIQALADDGHEIANHSYEHEPWLHRFSRDALRRELDLAEDRLRDITGSTPVGFRGPGFSYSAELLAELARRNYVYDCSTFPTFLGPIARTYYFLTAHLSSEERQERGKLFGSWSDGFRSLKPFVWDTISPPLVEIPVTTFPILRTPIHMSYIVFLGQRFPWLARTYFRSALMACKLRGVAPSLLLHPLDFLGCDDEPELAFFPGMNWERSRKLPFVEEILDVYLESFQVGTILDHAQRVLPLAAIQESAAT
jgi:peptidoglycan-N-acetylglucosamine deacetylase